MKKLIATISLTVCIAAGLLTQPLSAHAAKNVHSHSASHMKIQDGKLTAYIASAPLDSVMAEFSRLTGVEVLWQDRAVNSSVSAGFNARTPAEVVRHLLHGESYLLFYSPADGGEKLSRVLILPKRGEEKRKVVETRNALAEMMIKDLGPEDDELRKLFEAGI